MALSRELRGEVAPIDFAKPIHELVATLENFTPTHIYYFAGGGPFGKYHKKDFKDHEWAFDVNFKTPSWLIHWSLRRGGVRQFVVVGSAIAESSGEANGGSYAASKQALLGLCQSIWLESENFDLRLFSPGYMDTDLLPPGSTPRKQGWELKKPEEMARLFWNWVRDPKGRKHYVVK